MPQTPDAVLLITFGGPTKREEIRPFLEIVLRGRPAPPERVEEVVHHYEAIGGASPLNAITERQAEALRAELAKGEAGFRPRPSRPEGRSHPGSEGPSHIPVYVGMRNWHPFIGDALDRMASDGVGRVIAVILAAHRSEASIARYTEKVDEALARLGAGAPAIEYVEPWFDHPLFIEAVAARVEEALAVIPGDRRAAASWIFTAHSIPCAMAGVDVYQSDLRRSIELVCARLGREGLPRRSPAGQPDCPPSRLRRFGGTPAFARQVEGPPGEGGWTLAYQSRSGDPRTPWLGPDVGDAIRAEAAKGVKDVLLIPIGFVADHVEVLYDLDVEAKGIAEGLGLNLVRANTVGDHPAFVRMLADVVRGKLRGVVASS